MRFDSAKLNAIQTKIDSLTSRVDAICSKRMDIVFQPSKHHRNSGGTFIKTKKEKAGKQEKKNTSEVEV